MSSLIVCQALMAGMSPAIAEEPQAAQDVLKVRFLAERSVEPKGFIQWSILELALQKSGRPFDLDLSTLPTAPDRTAMNLTIYGDEGNVMWGAPRPNREIETLVVHVPLLRGMFQYWLIWAKKDEIDRFAQIRTAEDLAQFSVLQGPKWSTIPGFQKHSISVVEGDFANMPDMLASGRADLMPYSAIGTLGMFNGREEELGVAPLPNVMLIWPGEHFLMVDRNNQDLHDALKEGLLRAFEDGSHAELLRTHPESKNAFRGINLDAINLIYLENPYMTPAAQAAIDEYAVSPAEVFGAKTIN
ncbi:hypothetical protein CCR78_08030 [Rhodovulum imhoffii]|nr:hypothetical protein [Rhodovulum imhoffii]